jgi:hypothetical protein
MIKIKLKRRKLSKALQLWLNFASLLKYHKKPLSKEKNAFIGF